MLRCFFFLFRLVFHRCLLAADEAPPDFLRQRRRATADGCLYVLAADEERRKSYYAPPAPITSLPPPPLFIAFTSAMLDICHTVYPPARCSPTAASAESSRANIISSPPSRYQKRRSDTTKIVSRFIEMHC